MSLTFCGAEVDPVHQGNRRPAVGRRVGGNGGDDLLRMFIPQVAVAVQFRLDLAAPAAGPRNARICDRRSVASLTGRPLRRSMQGGRRHRREGESGSPAIDGSRPARHRRPVASVARNLFPGRIEPPCRKDQRRQQAAQPQQRQPATFQRMSVRRGPRVHQCRWLLRISWFGPLASLAGTHSPGLSTRGRSRPPGRFDQALDLVGGHVRIGADDDCGLRWFEAE